ncbi:diiron oxygenase [Aeromicrobium sp.]|uniref:AurF N-oxygenase family protein n=1 Tax=Aeromicrobium sp. TaxID=1871063 RepID=UPI0030BF1458
MTDTMDVGSAPAPAIPARLTYDEYADVLQGLSQASVDRHFDAFVDVPWDSPDFAIDHQDPRWVLPPDTDPLGGHEWYLALPIERQIEIGLWRQANILKVGLQFENILIRGIMQYVFSLRNGSPEFRYLTHEATEECHHTQMFQETVNRIGVDVPGMTRPIKMVVPFLPMVASFAPVGFFMMVLAGEEPIDHTQKAILRSGRDLPPVMRRIMQIHVAEEARHISFAHEYVKRRGPRMGRINRLISSIAFPIIMRAGCDLLMVPPRSFRKEFGIPRSVMKDLYWKAPGSRDRLQELFADVRMLAEQSGLMNPAARWMWRLLKIDGPSSRYRSEPPVAFVGR